jgi:glucosamine--fructose-6-phosphate aminotransferase (isomerizing)
MKELTYLHCQSINLPDLGNNFFSYFKKYPGSPTVFIILDCQKNKVKMLDRIEKLHAQANFMPIIVTDIKDKTLRERMTAFSEDRIFFIQRSGYKYDGFTLSALLAVIPLQRLAYDLTLALGYHPDRPRNLAKELTT